MAKKAIYGKYECVATPYNYYTSVFKETRHVAINIESKEPIATGIGINSSTGKHILTGEKTTYTTWIYYQNFYPFWLINYKNDAEYYYDFYDPGGFNGSANKDVYVSTAETHYNYSKGTYLTDTIADLGTLPVNGRHSDGYWYVYIKMASDLKGNDTGIWRDIPTGWANDSGIWKPQSELKANVNGIFK